MTVKELAQLIGVSPSAISRYLNGGSLAEDKRRIIQAGIEKTGYKPNAAGQMLRTGRGNLIGVIAPKVNSESFSHVTAGIADGLADTNYLILLGNCDRQTDRELEYLSAMQENHVAGIILMGTVLTPAHRSLFETCRVPLVITGQNFTDMHCVYHDDYHATYALTGAMIRHGHRRIAYIGVDERDRAAGMARRKGVHDAILDAGLGDRLPCSTGEFTPESGYACMNELLAQEPQLDGVICATDMIALGAMSALKSHNIRIPEDVGIAGVGNSWAGTISVPQLTTVNLNYHQCGVDAANLLLRLIETKNMGDGITRQTMLGYSVIERGSL